MVAEQTANTVDYDPVEILIPRGQGKDQNISEILVAEMINHYATLKKMVIGSIMNKKEKLCNEFNDALGPVYQCSNITPIRRTLNSPDSNHDRLIAAHKNR